jgi:uncharacterized protein YcfJ
MKRFAIALTVAATLAATLAASGTAFAGHRWQPDGRDGHVAYARVTWVRPVLRPAWEDRRVCYVRRVGERVERGPDRAAGTLLGAVIGGALGHTMGRGDGRAAATVAGAVIGGAIGNQAARSDDGYRDAGAVYQRRCHVRTVRDGRRVVGYVVAYRYHGRHFRTRMDHAPGRFMRVWVDDGWVRPAG